MVTCSWCVEKSRWHYSKTPLNIKQQKSCSHPTSSVKAEVAELGSLASRDWQQFFLNVAVSRTRSRRPHRHRLELLLHHFTLFFFLWTFRQKCAAFYLCFDSEDFNYHYVKIGLDPTQPHSGLGPKVYQCKNIPGGMLMQFNIVLWFTCMFVDLSRCNQCYVILSEGLFRDKR